MTKVMLNKFHKINIILVLLELLVHYCIWGHCVCGNCWSTIWRKILKLLRLKFENLKILDYCTCLLFVHVSVAGANGLVWFLMMQKVKTMASFKERSTLHVQITMASLWDNHRYVLKTDKQLAVCFVSL